MKTPFGIQFLKEVPREAVTGSGTATSDTESTYAPTSGGDISTTDANDGCLDCKS